ncbi:hypothetical protein LO739_24010 (plasmid) [Leclercia adecarboxylata]|uniref:hypothetical protein n=1 Tax=Leclercia adecarboxylata TaxID=83655 RepID=UPI001E3C10B5|nr:hypothetical protein [Leclercia adecarboxylata]UFM72026.1 hypothetical protein LO739_24010 [Leclercia adecarboxylata]
MPSILLFVGGKPPRRLEINEFRAGISYLYPDNVTREIPVKVIFGTFLDGQASAVLVAADRQVMRDEIARAHRRLIAWPDLAKKLIRLQQSTGSIPSK